MLYNFINSPSGQKSTCISLEYFPNNEKWTRCNYSNQKWYYVLQIESTYPVSCMTPATVN